jgi:alpha/beta superfamily hydrolase
MHNKVVYRIARALRSQGAAVLRFNYRGVNLSEGAYAQGEGELEDARAALGFLRSRYPALPVTLAGFSFGSRIVLRLGCGGENVRRVIAVGFPTAYHDRAYLETCKTPRLFVQSTHDQFGPAAELGPLVAALPEPKELRWVESQDHFFAGNLDGLEETITALGA